MYQGVLFLRQQNGCFREVFPIQALPTAVTVRLVFPFHSLSTLGADWEASKAMKEVKAADLRHWHGFAERHFPPNCRGNQQVIWCQIKTNAEFFQCQDRWGGFASGNVAKVPRTEVTSFRGSFIAKLASIT